MDEIKKLRLAVAVIRESTELLDQTRGVFIPLFFSHTSAHRNLFLMADKHQENEEGISGLDASHLRSTPTRSPRPVPTESAANASQDTICTDHMILADWRESTGWAKPDLMPYGPLSLMPTSSCLHYATECFEGLKAYRGYDGRLRVFRLDRNVRRFLMSATRVSLPQFEPLQVKNLIMALLSVDGPRWLPKARAGSFLYVRPALIGTHQQLGVSKPKEAKLFIVASFMARLDVPDGGLRLLTSPENSLRAWVGGFGHAKIGANYGPSVLPLQEATAMGFHQILWLYGDQNECTEAGGSNFFVAWKRKGDGKKELITAPLDDKIILDGVTRRSCLDLATKRLSSDVEVVERKFTISEIIEASAEGRLLEAFVSGTAVSFPTLSFLKKCRPN